MKEILESPDINEDGKIDQQDLKLLQDFLKDPYNDDKMDELLNAFVDPKNANSLENLLKLIDTQLDLPKDAEISKFLEKLSNLKNQVQDQDQRLNNLYNQLAPDKQIIYNQIMKKYDNSDFVGINLILLLHVKSNSIFIKF